MDNVIVTITGPSGSGKSTMERALREKGFMPLISLTTRPKRQGEINGQNYYFVDKAQFKRLEAQGALVESVEFNDNYYGLLKSEVQRAKDLGMPVVIVVEPNGQKQIAEYAESIGIELLSVFVDIDPKEQFKRLLGRFHSEISNAKRQEYGEVYEAHASRFVISAFEEISWGTEKYNIHVTYDRESERGALDLITNKVDDILAKQATLLPA